MSFSKLLDDIARERDLRATARQAQFQIEEIRAGGRSHRKAIAGMVGELQVMAKAMTVDLAETRAGQRQAAADSLARINTRATEMARTGELTGEQGAILDGLLHLAAMRVAAL